ncbi:MAG: PilZ domain-containing protein [Phycisphaerales bacterium]|nr:PilZ domain-containing protein [Phycisphaerales bacterium]
MLTSSLGEVIDISAAGMRIAHRGQPRVEVGQGVEITLAFASTEVRLAARIVWMRRTGFRRHEIGVEFCDADPDTRTCLTEIARCAAKLAGFRPEAA